MLRDSFEMLPKSLAHCTRFPRISPYGPLNSKFVLMAEISLKEKFETDLKKSDE